MPKYNVFSTAKKRGKQEIKVGDEKNRNNQPATKPVNKTLHE